MREKILDIMAAVRTGDKKVNDAADEVIDEFTRTLPMRDELRANMEVTFGKSIESLYMSDGYITGAYFVINRIMSVISGRGNG